MKFLATVTVLVCLFLPATALAAGSVILWNTAEEAVPPDSESLAQANDRLHDVKVNTRARGEVEHWWGDVGSGADDNGMHRVGSARCFSQDAAPTTLSDSMGTLDSTTPTRLDVTDLNDAASNSGAAIADDVGHARCWVDLDGADGVANEDCTGNDTDDASGSPTSAGTSACCDDVDIGTCDVDDNALYFYEGVAGDNTPSTIANGWELVSAGYASSTLATGHTHAATSVDDEVLAGSPNLIYNSGFEATDGTGFVAATAVPSGWAAIDAATFTYGTSTDPDLRWGDGVYAIVTDVDGSDGMSVVLNNLPAATTFKVLARVAEEDASDICTVTTTGADTDMTPAVSAGITWQTLSGTFITAAALDDVTVTFISTAAGDICNWDNISVYQIGDTTTDRDEIALPGPVIITDTVTLTSDLATTTPAAITGLSIDVTPPTQNCIIDIQAIVSVQVNAAGSGEVGWTCRIDEETVNKTALSRGGSRASSSGVDNVYTDSMILPYRVANKTPGTAYTYTVECADNLYGNSGSDPYADLEYDCTDMTCSITAIMTCGGH